MLIKEHNRDYVVLVLREVDDVGEQGDHSHSIVIDTNSSHGKFDLESLMTALEGSQMESLNDSFVKSRYVPWQNTLAKSIASRLRVIFQTLDRYALANVGPKPAIGRANSTGKRKECEARTPPASAGVASRQTTPKPGQARSKPQNRETAASEDAGQRKKRKKNLPGGLADACSSGSMLTTLSVCPSTTATPVPDFEKFAVIQRNF